MTEQENIWRLAREAGLIDDRNGSYIGRQGYPALEKFAALVKAETVAETREACAKLCDRVAELAGRFAKRGGNEFDCGAVDGAEHCAESIRAMAATPSRDDQS